MSLTAVGWALAVATMTVQIPYPLAGEPGRRVLTVASVLLFCAASVVHAAGTRGPGWATGMIAVTVGGSLAAEIIGVHTSLVFGRYAYTEALGPRLAGVPAVVPLAWTMMAYPAFVLGQHLARRFPRTGCRPGNVADAGRSVAVTALVGGLLLTTWDLYLDPQMVDAGYWHWSGGGPALNGVPLSNAAGWSAVGTAITAALALLPRPRDVGDQPFPDRLPLVMIGWTYASSLLANLVFFDRPAVAVAGGVGMGSVLTCVALVVMTDRAPRRHP